MPRNRDLDNMPPAAMPDFLVRHATLRQLQVFEAIVRLGSFTRAAEELFLTQPTVSMQIKKLADSLGLPLFEHIGRNVRPTEAGEELYASCRTVLEVLANLEMKLADLKGIKRGRLRLSVITTAKYFAPELLGDFWRLYPGIEVALKVSNRDRIIERINANEDDLYIMGQVPPERSDLAAHAIAPNPLAVLAPRDHPLVGQKNIPLARIAEEALIQREPGSGTRDASLKLFKTHGLIPKVRMELGSSEAIKHAIAGGLGLSVMSLHTLTLAGRDGPVAVLDVEGLPIMREWYIVYPRGKELSLVAQAFLEYALEIEPRMRARMMALWPRLNEHLKDSGGRTRTKATQRA